MRHATIIVILCFGITQNANGLSQLCSSLEGSAVEVKVEENDDARVYHLFLESEYKDHSIVDVAISYGESGSVLVETPLFKENDQKSYASFVGFKGHREIYVRVNYGLGACTRQNVTIIEAWSEKDNDT